ncbi:MAG TPA: hypothetical protein VIM98_05915 [Dyella sp.]|uniref:hypothetical protein n=1 Tax=Dyella sp. TaxID=1869338 RepID=UPI002F94410D
MERKKAGKAKSGGSAQERTWGELGKAQRQQNSALPNRLELSLDWWAKQPQFQAEKNYAERDPHVYRFAAKALDAAGYQFLQIDRAHGQRNVVDRYGGLVDPKSRKRSFAIEPGYRQGQLTGQEQRAHQGNFVDTTFPDLVVKKPSSDRPIGIELKVAKRYGYDAPSQSLKNLFEGTYGGADKYFQGEFHRRTTVTPTHERRLLVDVNTSGLSKREALEYFRVEHGSHGDQFHFDSLQFIHRKKGNLKLSSAYQTADGFSKSGKIREGGFNSSRSSLVGRGSIANAFAQVAPRQSAPAQLPAPLVTNTTTSTTPSLQLPPLTPGSFQALATPPGAFTPPSLNDSSDRKRKRASSSGSQDSAPSTPVQQPQAPTSPRLDSGPEKKKPKLVPRQQDVSRHSSPVRNTPPSSPRHGWSGDDSSPPSSPVSRSFSNLQGPPSPTFPVITPAPVRPKPQGTSLKTKKDGTPDKRSSGYRKQEENKKAAKGTPNLFGYFKTNQGPGPGPGPGSGQGGGITVRK